MPEELVLGEKSRTQEEESLWRGEGREQSRWLEFGCVLVGWRSGGNQAIRQLEKKRQHCLGTCVSGVWEDRQTHTGWLWGKQHPQERSCSKNALQAGQELVPESAGRAFSLTLLSAGDLHSAWLPILNIFGRGLPFHSKSEFSRNF